MGPLLEFLVNGAGLRQGSNWIPADFFPTRLSDEHLETLIGAAPTPTKTCCACGVGLL